jgi:hypothetical protein
MGIDTPFFYCCIKLLEYLVVLNGSHLSLLKASLLQADYSRTSAQNRQSS